MLSLCFGRRARLSMVATWVLIGLAACRGASAQGHRDAQLRLDFLDVGQGDSTLITSPTGKTVLIDGGLPEAGQVVLDVLAQHRIDTLDLVFLTHRHADHLGGLLPVVEQRGLRMFMDAPYPHDIRQYGRLLTLLQEKQVPVRQASRGRKVDLGGGASMTILGPPEPAISDSRSDVNANSVATRIDFGRVGILMAADAEAQTEAWLIDSGAELRAAVLKVAHHGSRYSSTPRFLRAVQPLVAVVSVGTGNEYHHPDPQTIGRLERTGARVFRTDLDGPVSVESDGQRIVVRAQGRQEVIAAP